MNPALRKAFEAQLTEVALKNLWRFARRHVHEGAVEETNQKAWDAVMEAICDVLSGTRIWDAEAEPDAIRFLARAVRSEIYNSNAKADTARTESLEDEHVEGPKGPFELPTVQNDIEADEFFMALLEQVEGDKECEDVLWCFRDGCSKPKEVAEALGITVDAVYVIKKRLQRKLASFQSPSMVKQ